jgi:hypothetical protein
MSLEALERRERALLAFCQWVRERGGRAVVEEDEDLPRLRAQISALQALRAGRGAA